MVASQHPSGPWLVQSTKIQARAALYVVGGMYVLGAQTGYLDAKPLDTDNLAGGHRFPTPLT